MIHISVWVGQKEHGSRRWPAVPRIGETMLVTVNDKLEYLKVVDVQWGVTDASRRTDMCDVAVFCKAPRARKER